MALNSPPKSPPETSKDAPHPSHAPWAPALLFEHVLQGAGQELENGVQDALLLLILVVPTAPWDGLLGPGQRALTRLLQRCLLLRLLFLLLLQPVLRR